MDTTWLVRSDSPFKEASPPIHASTFEYSNGARQVWHSHEEAQFVYTSRGVLRVHTPHGVWPVAPMRGLWLPPRLGHELHAVGTVVMHSLYLAPEAIPSLSTKCLLTKVTSLLDELVRSMVDDKLEKRGDRYSLIVPLLLREIEHAQEIHESGLPLPNDRRLRQIYELLMAAPDNSHPLDFWGSKVGASERTLARLFRAETGLTFGQWRQQLRIVEAVSQLALGTPVSAIAAGLGYRNSSAFITMFKKTMGETPQRYLRQ